MGNNFLLGTSDAADKANIVYLSLGSNKVDRKAFIARALVLLQESGVEVIRSSSFYRTAPWGNKDQDWFLNIAIKANTNLSPFELLRLCKAVEVKAGRTASEKWGPREIDIDILYFNDLQMQSEELEIPHPFLYNRLFVLLPLKEIAPDWVDPINDIPIDELIDTCKDESRVIKLRKRQS